MGVFVLLGGVALAGLFLRFYHLDADPPDWMYVYNTDEGQYSYTAQNRLVFGHWFMNEARYGLITPLFAFAQYVVCLAGGGNPTIANYRLVSAVCGVLSCGLMALFFSDRWRRLAAVSLASVSFIGFVHSRLGITEMMLALVMQLAVLAAWQAFQRASFLLAAVSGAAAVGALMVKPTAVIMVPIVLLAPLLCRAAKPWRGRYWLGVAAGGALAASLWVVVVVMPYREAWRQLMLQATSFGRAAISLDPAAAAANLRQFLLSPALLTMPFLWPMALCWCVLSWGPRWRRGESDMLDSLLLLWIAAGAAALGIPAYQPARWQVMLFPAVICAGLKFLPDLQRTSAAVAAFLVSIGVSVLYSICAAGRFLKGGAVQPIYGVFGHYGAALAAGALFSLAWLGARALGGEKWQRLASGVVALELAVQCGFHAEYTRPSLFRPSQWSVVARDLEQLPPRESAIFAGEFVQDLSLRAKIRVLPTFYLVNKPTDQAVREFFVRENCVPNYFVLADNNVSAYMAEAPVFTGSLEEIARYPLCVGGIGNENLHVFRFISYEWLNSPGQKTPIPSLRPPGG